MSPVELDKAERIRKSEALFERLFESSPDGILVADDQGHIVRANGPAEAMFGYGRSELNGQLIEVLVPERFHETHAMFRKDYIARIRSHSGSIRVEADAKRRDGTEFPAEIIVTPVVESAEGPLVVAVVRDIARRKEAESTERFLAAISDTIPDPVFVKDEKHRWVLLNDACCQFMQYPRERLIGKSDYDFFPKEEADVFWAKDNLVLETGNEDINEENFTDRNGATHIILTRKSLYTDPTGKKFIVGTIRDITARKRAEEALREREEQLQSILDNSPAVMYVKDLDGRYLKANRHCAEGLGTTEQQIIGKSTYDFFPADLGDQIRAHERQVVEARSAMQFEDQVLHEDGLHTYLAVKFPLLDSSGNPYAVCGISTDITRRKQAEEAVRESEERFRQIAENIREVFWIRDYESAQVLYVSPAYEEIWDRPRESFYVRPFD